MIINNGVLNKVEKKDIDENGKVVIPKSITAYNEEAFVGLENDVKSVEFEEGITEISSALFYDMPNLEDVVFPSTLESLGWYQMFSHTPKASIHLNSNPRFPHNVFGAEETSLYIENQLDHINATILDEDITKEEALSILKSFDNIIEHESYYLKNAELSAKFKTAKLNVINLLRTRTKDNQEVGAVLTKQEINSDKAMSNALILYNQYKMCEEMNILDQFKPLIIDNNFNKGLIDEDNIVHLNVDSLSDFKRVPEGVNTNFKILFTIAHELSHLYQRSRNPHSENKEDRELYVGSKIQKCEDGYDIGHPTRHISKHDFFPDELDADIRAFDLIINKYATEYGFDASLVEKIKNYKDLREHIAFEYVGKQDDSYLNAFLKKALTKEMSDGERQKLQQCYDDYMKINQEWNVNPINI